jgi:hypothetical protein
VVFVMMPMATADQPGLATIERIPSRIAGSYREVEYFKTVTGQPHLLHGSRHLLASFI